MITCGKSHRIPPAEPMADIDAGAVVVVVVVWSRWTRMMGPVASHEVVAIQSLLWHRESRMMMMLFSPNEPGRYLLLPRRYRRCCL